MTLRGAAFLTLLALAPKPRAGLAPKPQAVGYSFAAGRCSEEIPAGGTAVQSRLAVGTTARLSATVQFSRPCDARGTRRCPAIPLEVKALGGLHLASVRGTDIRLEARAPGPAAVALRTRKKQFPELAIHTVAPAALAAHAGTSPELRALRIAQGGAVVLSLAVVDEERNPLCAGGKVPASAPALGIGTGVTWDLLSQKEVRAVGPPGWSFLELRVGGQRPMMPVEIVAPRAIQRLVLERQPPSQGSIRVVVRAYDDTGEVLGAGVRLWLQGDGSLVRLGHSDRPARELETTDPEVAVVPGRVGAPIVLSAQTANGITSRLDLHAQR